MLAKKNVLGVGITNATENEILEYILGHWDKKICILTPNPELIVLGRKNPLFLGILNRAQIALCDGVGLFLAAQFLGQGVKQRISGVDFMQRFCQEVSRKPITVGFLGGGPGVAERTADCLKTKYSGLKVAFTGSEWQEYNTYNGYKNYKDYKKIDILFVAFGSPKQEEWITKNLETLPVHVVMGVGGAFDFVSGAVSRAPVWIRKIGLEWLFRLAVEPWRIKRQLALIEFILLVLKEKLHL
ncbi:MAG: hypothetical protein A3J69_00010 [Candidatus Levybacteria bacterium RIFCSPHIGHO2_02_FULL_42_12]|nr:MAG: hypothetical protein A3J69_00010 [Candidatus Levybacteria bacterium RIFCSPHIGHO2_02_FULL_42_12]OGH43050.1 MAG: hypothetical protein A3B53_00725 [Candidatus Levybacteria bacterium RIFCSPLOWO2_01_FULL_42_15]